MNVEGYRLHRHNNNPLPVPEFVADPAGMYDDAPEGKEGDKSAFEMGATNVRNLQVI